MVSALRHLFVQFQVIACSLGLGALLLMAGLGLFVSGKNDKPKLEISCTTLDLGDGSPNELMRGQLILRNTGSSPLLFSIMKSCGCTFVHPPSGTIEPTQTLPIQIEVRLPAYADSERNIVVGIKSNDLQRGEITCSVLARCPAPLIVTPPFAEFGQLLPEQLDQAVQDIRVDAVPSQHHLTVDQLKVTQTSSEFTTSALEIDGGRAIIRIKPGTFLKRGDHYDTIGLSVLSSDNVMRIPVHLQVVDPMLVTPSTVFLRRDLTTHQYLPVELQVITRRSGASLGKISIANTSAGLRLEDLNGDSKRRRVRILIDEALWNPPGSIELHAEGIEGVSSVRVMSPSS